MRSCCSFLRNSVTSSVRLMTFLKEKGASLLGQGSFSLGTGGGRGSGAKAHLCPRPSSLGGRPLGSFQAKARTPASSATHFSGLMSVWGTLTLSTNLPNPIV